MKWVVKVIYETDDDSCITEKTFDSYEEALAYQKEQDNPEYDGTAILYELHADGTMEMILRED